MRDDDHSFAATGRVAHANRPWPRPDSFLFRCLCCWLAVASTSAVKRLREEGLDDGEIDADDLWEGLDREAPTEAESRFRAFARSDRPLLPSQGRKRVLQIAGMFDSGTHLLGELLRKNLGKAKMGELCPEAAKPGHEFSCYWWKHAPPHELERQLEAKKRLGLDVVLVAMVRSPLSQIASWQKAPYELVTTCMRPPTVLLREARNCSIRQTLFPGFTGLWNAYTQEYSRLAAKSPDEVFVVEYERLVLEPRNIVLRIAEALGVQLVGRFVNIEKKAKLHGGPRGRGKAIETLAEATYLRQGPLREKDVQQALCDRLDEGLLDRFEIPTSPPRMYSSDCAFVSHPVHNGSTPRAA